MNSEMMGFPSMKTTFGKGAIEVFGLLLRFCGIHAASICLSYLAYSHTVWIVDISGRDCLVFVIALPYCLFAMRGFGVAPIIIASALFVPMFYLMYFIIGCSFFGDCI